MRAATATPTRDLDDTGDPLALEHQVCFALSVAAREVVATYQPLLKPLGLTHPQYLVMLALWEHGETSVKRLSELLHLEPATMSPLLKRLEGAGYVERRRNADDERSLTVGLTPNGKRLRRKALRVPPAVVARLGLTADELIELHTSLTRVIAAAHPVGAGPER